LLIGSFARRRQRKLYLMIYLISPPGGNTNYLCLKILGSDTGNTISYHGHGSHSDGDSNQILNFSQLSRKSDATKVIMINTADFHNAKDLITDGDVIIQNYIDRHREILLLNWFHKITKPLDGQITNTVSGYRDSWIKWQTNLWRNNSKRPVVSAVAEWMYKLFDDNFVDIKRLPEVTKVFNWSVMYESPQDTIDEFKKIGYNYTVEEYDEWLVSQKTILGHWRAIGNNIDTPLSFDDDVHNGIALALHGKQHNLDRKQVESKFNLLP